MKKRNTKIFAAFISLAATSTSLVAQNEARSYKTTEPTEKAAQNVINVEGRAAENRIYEIYRMDKNSLNATEKQQLREEVKGIQRAVTGPSGGLYISAGAIIIILLILLILI
jgi:predicted Mrr-cat superfamily restriction endonuclease